MEHGLEVNDSVTEGVEDTQVVPEVEGEIVPVEHPDLVTVTLVEKLGLDEEEGVRVDERVPVMVGELLRVGVSVKLALPPVGLPDRVTVREGVVQGVAELVRVRLLVAQTVGDCVPLLLNEGLWLGEADGHIEGVTT